MLIALSDAERVHYAIIDQPYTGERFTGGLGRADWSGPLGTRALGTRRTTALSEARLMTTFPEIGSPAERAAFDRVAARAQLTRYGTDCYAYALLAAGQVDLVIEAGLNAYDIQAPIAATPELHRAALALLAG